MNDSNADGKLLDARIRVVQIIVGALMAGVVVFAGYVIFCAPTNQAAGPAAGAPAAPVAAAPTPVLSIAAVAIFAAALLMWAIVPNRLADAQVAKIAAGTWTPQASESGPPRAMTDSEKLLAVFTTKATIAAALLEGPAFLGSAAYMIERHAFTLGVAAWAVALMVITFPTRDRVVGWLEKQQAFIDETRQFGGSPRL